MNDCLLILGMHRSGTSALAGALKLVGVDLGSRLMPGREGENEAGFFEHLAIYDLHLKLLSELGHTWHDLRRIPAGELLGRHTQEHREQLKQLLAREFSESRLWGVKDPRLCRLLPLWLEVLGEMGCEPRCAIVFRHPAEVASSLAIRDRFSVEKSAFLWMDHNLLAEAQTRHLRRAFVDFGRLLEEPHDCLTAIGELLGIDWPVGPGGAVDELGGFLRPELKHHTREEPPDGSLGRLSRQAVGLFATLREAHLGDGNGGRERFERTERSYREAFDSLDPLLLELATHGPPAHDQVEELERSLSERTHWLTLQDEQLQQQQERLEQHRETLELLSQRLDSSQRAVPAEHQETTAALVHEIEGLKQQITSRSGRMRRLEEMLEESRRTLSEVPSSQLRLTQRLGHLEQSLGQEVGLSELLQEQLRAAWQRQRALEGELGRLLESLAKTQADLDRQEAQLNAAGRRQRALEGELTPLRESLARTQADLDRQEAQFEAAGKRQRALEGALRPLGESLGAARADLDSQREQLRAGAHRQRALEGALGAQEAALGELREGLGWQGESLVELRRDLEEASEKWRLLLADQTARLAAQDERLRELAGGLDNVRQTLTHSANLAEMMWTSKPWRAYLWLAQAWRAISRRLTAGRDRLRRRGAQAAVDPSPPWIADTPESPRADFPVPAPARGNRALIIDHRLPTPDQDSGSLRMTNLITVLQELGFRVTFLPHNLHLMEPYATQMSAREIDIIARPEVESIAEHLEARGAAYDLVIVCRVTIARNCLEDVLTHCRQAKVVFDTVDLQYLRKERQARLEGNLTLMEEARQRKREELAAARSSDSTWVVSPYEKNLLEQEVPELQVEIVPNIHHVFGSKAGFAERRDMLFIGGFEHPPNVDAVEWLVHEILPLVHERLPELRLYLIGSKPTPRVQLLASELVTVTGYVPDVEPYFARCRLSVAPLRYGAGVKGKVNQSMAHGLPCVLTQIAAEGMGLVHGEDAMIANDPASFADCIVSLYQDADLWQRLSQGGIENVRRCFSFEVARVAVERCLRTVGHRSAGGQAESAT